MADKKKHESPKWAMERVFSNPKNAKLVDDKDIPDPPPDPLKIGHPSPDKAGMGDISNPPKADVEPDPIRSFKTGTPYVPKDGVYMLHEGEAVVPKEDNKVDPYGKITEGDKKPRKAIKSMHVTKTDNGRHIVTHEHHHPQHHKDAVHAMNSIEELSKHMADNAPGIEAQAPGADEPAAPAGGASPAGPAPAAPAGM